MQLASGVGKEAAVNSRPGWRLGGFMMLGLAIGMAGCSLTCAAKAADYFGLPRFFPKYSVASSRPMMAVAITAGVRISCGDKPKS
jgi:hypothetical protein